MQTLDQVTLRFLLPLRTPEGEFLHEKHREESPWKAEPWTTQSTLPLHSEDTLQSSLQYLISEPMNLRGDGKTRDGITVPLGELGLYRQNQWVIPCNSAASDAVEVTFGRAGILSSKVGLAFVWIDIEIQDVHPDVLMDIIRYAPNHRPNKVKGSLQHRVNPHPNAYKGYPKTHFSVVELLESIARNACEWNAHTFGEAQSVYSMSRRALTYGSVVSQEDTLPEGEHAHRLGSQLSHYGFSLLEKASPTWQSTHPMSAVDQHGFWGREDALFYVGLGSAEAIKSDLPHKFMGLWEHFLSFTLAQGALSMANHIEDDLKESAANRNLEHHTVRRFRKRFEAAEWRFLQVQWNLDHTLLHMEPVRFNLHQEYRDLLGVPQALDRIQAQSEMINAYFTRKFERSLEDFVLAGAMVGAVTALFGINIRHWTSEDGVGLTTWEWFALSSMCIGVLLFCWMRSLYIRHPTKLKGTGLRLDGWARWVDPS